MQTILTDLRYGARMLSKRPGFTAIAVLTLALAIAANTAIFSVLDAALFHPLPFEKPERLMHINDGASYLLNLFPMINGGQFMEWREPVNSFETVAAYEIGSVNLSDEHNPERTQILQVTAGFFPLLRVRPALGRLFNDDEVRRGESRLLILSHGFWKQRFGGDEKILGKQVRLNGISYTVIGVLPDRFEYQVYGQKPEAFIPYLPIDPLFGREAFFSSVIGRLKDGVTQTSAQAELKAISERLTKATRREVKIGMQPLLDLYVGNLRQPLLLLLSAVACVLLIACANIANLLVARALTRRSEVAVRAALGASRRRLIRQWLTESLLLALIGGAAGLLFAGWIIDAMVAIYPAPLTMLATPGINARALLFTLAVTMLTGLLFGCAPAWQFSRPDLTTALKDGGQFGPAGGGSRLRKVLMIGEVALTLALLMGAGLLIKSFWRMLELRSGFHAEQVLTLELSPAPGKYSGSTGLYTLYQQIIDRVSALPGVQIAGASNHLPLSISSSGAMRRPLKILGQGSDFDNGIGGAYRVASSDYFRALNIPLRAGRFFDERDTMQSPRVMILNESMARAAFPNETPIGKLVTYTGRKDMQFEIVGVVGESYLMGVGGNWDQEFYLPLQQQPPAALRLAIRTSLNPVSLIASVREAVRQFDPDLPIFNVKTMSQIVAEAAAQLRFAMLSMGAFALAGLVLSSLGIYGVMSYLVEQRTHEIGVRMALGAGSSDVLSLIIRQGMGMVLLGIPLGLAGALGLAKMLIGILLGISSPFDPLTFTIIPLLLALIALLACWIPARRATKVDPLAALRWE